MVFLFWDPIEQIKMSSAGTAQSPKANPPPVYLEQEDLKEKYKQPRIDRIRQYCKSIKSIGLATNLGISVDEKDKGIIKISVSADPQSPKEALEKALNYVIGEFIKADCQSKYGGNGISGPGKANKPIDEDKQRSIQNDIKDGRRVLLTEAALRKHDLLVNCELRQFRCPKCFNAFWKTVLLPKRTARCHKCNIRLFPLKRSEEFGVGRFVCPTPTCDNVFYGRCRATDTRQCKICFSDVKTPYIHPCFRPSNGPLPHGVRRPQRIAKDELPVSKVHDCAGTCASTFVRQWDKTTSSESLGTSYSGYSRYRPKMPTFDCDEAKVPESQCGNDPGTSYSGYSRYHPEMPTFDCDEAEGPEPQCGNDKDSESDSESSPQDQAPDRRRSHTKSQDDDSD